MSDSDSDESSSEPHRAVPALDLDFTLTYRQASTMSLYEMTLNPVSKMLASRMWLMAGRSWPPSLGADAIRHQAPSTRPVTTTRRTPDAAAAATTGRRARPRSRAPSRLLRRDANGKSTRGRAAVRPAIDPRRAVTVRRRYGLASQQPPRSLRREARATGRRRDIDEYLLTSSSDSDSSSDDTPPSRMIMVPPANPEPEMPQRSGTSSTRRVELGTGEPVELLMSNTSRDAGGPSHSPTP